VRLGLQLLWDVGGEMSDLEGLDAACIVWLQGLKVGGWDGRPRIWGRG
jgi:hypothetical protein